MQEDVNNEGLGGTDDRRRGGNLRGDGVFRKIYTKEKIFGGDLARSWGRSSR